MHLYVFCEIRPWQSCHAFWRSQMVPLFGWVDSQQISQNHLQSNIALLESRKHLEK